MENDHIPIRKIFLHSKIRVTNENDNELQLGILMCNNGVTIYL